MVREVHRERLQRLQSLLEQLGSLAADTQSWRGFAAHNPYLVDDLGRPVRSRVRRRLAYLCEAYGLDWARQQRLIDLGLASTRDLDDDQLYALALRLEVAASAIRCGLSPEEIVERFL